MGGHFDAESMIPERLPNHDEVCKEGFALVWHVLDKSGNPVERAFDSLEREYKEIVLALADVESSDLVNPVSNQQSKLKHYTQIGRRKIAIAMFKIRMISKAFPAQMTIKDFINIDETMS
ncbi:hypothetical protein B0186_04855 [Canicola haemoglobinophilus]|uniref:Uncharacterized protein n=1 Tax=Canicola haemoglobinophilus TaxID=733 RepID=A0A1V4B1N3_9PAST|nr:hypothetical protein [Canicola haemoglobinophilus]OOS01070.1 hypothetical protein B0186_04855 [Canicola haemoglobinophilus]STO58842.1 Uncharacterised protein [Canicola haemoglobinophilus]STO60308.1 Uncharacterised protein [Canicola haemoglobinophilus]